jgi:PilZ domain-containing protein
MAMLPTRHAPGRSARVPTPEIEARIGSEFGRLINISATGALIRTHTAFLLGRQCPLFLHLEPPITLTVRIVRVERVTEFDEDGEPLPKYLIGVMFSEFSSSAKQALSKLCGVAFLQHDSRRL